MSSWIWNASDLGAEVPQGCELTAAVTPPPGPATRCTGLSAPSCDVHVLDGADDSFCPGGRSTAWPPACPVPVARTGAQHLEAHFGAQPSIGSFASTAKRVPAGIAHQNRGRFVVGAMTGRSPRRICHRPSRAGIVHEAVDMDQLNGGRGRVESRERRAE